MDSGARGILWMLTGSGHDPGLITSQRPRKASEKARVKSWVPGTTPREEGPCLQEMALVPFPNERLGAN